MKWNWGTKIFIAIIIFISFILVLVYVSTQHEILLVEKDYYPKGLKYQDRLDEIHNAVPYRNDIKVFQTGEKIVVTFPEIQPDTGTVVFFRPSSTQHDRSYQIQTDTTYTMQFPKSEFIKGKYLIKIYWSEDGKGYYIEKPFYFN